MRDEFDGEKYKQSSKHQKEWGNRLISELKIKGNEAILDLGCGDGVLTEELSMLVPHGKVIGIDASIGMINTAKKLERDNLIFICMDINDMDFVNQFDLVFSNVFLSGWDVVLNLNILINIGSPCISLNDKVSF